jgi:ribosome-associated translation inhibitor RaiA
MSLAWTLFTKNMRPDLQLRVKLQNEVNKFTKHLGDYPADKVQLRVAIEKFPGARAHLSQSKLTLPRQILRAKATDAAPVTAFTKSLADIRKQLKKSKA